MEVIGSNGEAIGIEVPVDCTGLAPAAVPPDAAAAIATRPAQINCIARKWPQALHSQDCNRL